MAIPSLPSLQSDRSSAQRVLGRAVQALELVVALTLVVGIAAVAVVLIK
jgi:hypothetical protein